MDMKTVLRRYWPLLVAVLGLLLGVILLTGSNTGYATGGSTVTQKHRNNVNTKTTSYGAGSISVSNVGTMRDFTVTK